MCSVNIIHFYYSVGMLSRLHFLLYTALNMACMDLLIYYRLPSSPSSISSFITVSCFPFLHLYSCSHHTDIFSDDLDSNDFAHTPEKCFPNNSSTACLLNMRNLLRSSRKLEAPRNYQYLSFCNVEQIS